MFSKLKSAKSSSSILSSKICRERRRPAGALTCPEMPGRITGGATRRGSSQRQRCRRPCAARPWPWRARRGKHAAPPAAARLRRCSAGRERGRPCSAAARAVQRFRAQNRRGQPSLRLAGPLASWCRLPLVTPVPQLPGVQRRLHSGCCALPGSSVPAGGRLQGPRLHDLQHRLHLRLQRPAEEGRGRGAYFVASLPSTACDRPLVSLPSDFAELSKGSPCEAHCPQKGDKASSGEVRHTSPVCLSAVHRGQSL